MTADEMPKVQLTDEQWAWLKQNELDRTNDGMATTAHQRAAMDAMVKAVANPAPVMSVRDQIAVSALNGLLASGKWSIATIDIETTLAVISYQYADAMIEAGK
jgi:hypothetical protein